MTWQRGLDDGRRSAADPGGRSVRSRAVREHGFGFTILSSYILDR